MNKIRITKKNIIIEIAVNIFKDGNHYIADCPALELCTQGITIKEASKHFKEAIELWFEVTIERKTLLEALKELGWDFKQIQNGEIVPTPEYKTFFKKPVSLIAQQYYPITIPSTLLASA